MSEEPYGRSPLFDEFSLPDALRNKHRTKPGTWGMLRVLEGEVRLVFTDPPSEQVVTIDTPATIPPQAVHYVVPDRPMKMMVEFYREKPVPAGPSSDG